MAKHPLMWNESNYMKKAFRLTDRQLTAIESLLPQIRSKVFPVIIDTHGKALNLHFSMN